MNMILLQPTFLELSSIVDDLLFKNNNSLKRKILYFKDSYKHFSIFMTVYFAKDL